MPQMYETVVAYDGALPDEALNREQEQLERFLKENGKLERTDVWGKKNLAYGIRKKRSAWYCVFYYHAAGDIGEKLARRFKLNENVLRFMTVQHVPGKKTRPEGGLEEVRRRPGRA